MIDTGPTILIMKHLSGRLSMLVAAAMTLALSPALARVKARALSWYRRASCLGDAIGQFNLGDMISRGQGQVPVEASMWLDLAAGQGNRWAVERKRELAQTMTPNEVALAERRIGERQPPLIMPYVRRFWDRRR